MNKDHWPKHAFLQFLLLNVLVVAVNFLMSESLSEGISRAKGWNLITGLVTVFLVTALFTIVPAVLNIWFADAAKGQRMSLTKAFLIALLCNLAYITIIVIFADFVILTIFGIPLIINCLAYFAFCYRFQKV